MIALSALIGLTASLNTAWGMEEKPKSSKNPWSFIESEGKRCGGKSRPACSLLPNNCTWSTQMNKCQSQIYGQNMKLEFKVREQHDCFTAKDETICTGKKACFWAPTSKDQGNCGWKGK